MDAKAPAIRIYRYPDTAPVYDGLLFSWIGRERKQRSILEMRTRREELRAEREAHRMKMRDIMRRRDAGESIPITARDAEIINAALAGRAADMHRKRPPKMRPAAGKLALDFRPAFAAMRALDATPPDDDEPAPTGPRMFPDDWYAPTR